MTPWTDRTRKQPTSLQRQTAIDITAEDLLPRLSVQHVADLVLLSMVRNSLELVAFCFYYFCLVTGNDKNEANQTLTICDFCVILNVQLKCMTKV